MSTVAENRAAAVEATRPLAEVMPASVVVAPTFEAMISEPGVYSDIPAAAYFADPVMGGSLSSTGARRLIEQAGPAKYRYALDHPEEPKDSFDFGIAAHQLVLGDPDERLVVVSSDEWRTNAVKAEVAAARAAGKTPIRPKDAVKVEAMAAAIRHHPQAVELLRKASGNPEQTLVWRDDLPDVWCRARIDWFRNPVADKRMIVVDYKTCEHADNDSFAKAATDYGYHQQAAFYLAGVRALGLDRDPAFLFVAQEKQPPYLVNVIELDDVDMGLGYNLNRMAIGIYEECTRTEKWPGYLGVSYVSLPGWYRNRWDED